MAPTRSVLFCGDSLFLAAIKSSFCAVRGLEIQQVDARSGNLLDNVRAAAPDFIVFELTSMSDQTAFSLLKEFPGVDMIGLEPETHRVLILSVREQTSPNTADLVQLIQEKGVAAQQG